MISNSKPISAFLLIFIFLTNLTNVHLDRHLVAPMFPYATLFLRNHAITFWYKTKLYLTSVSLTINFEFYIWHKISVRTYMHSILQKFWHSCQLMLPFHTFTYHLWMRFASIDTIYACKNSYAPTDTHTYMTRFLLFYDKNIMTCRN